MNSLKSFRSFKFRDQFQLRNTIRPVARYSINEGRPQASGKIFVTLTNMGDVDAEFKFQAVPSVVDREQTVEIFNPWNPVEPTGDSRVTVDFTNAFQQQTGADINPEGNDGADITITPKGQLQLVVELPADKPFLQVVPTGAGETRVLMESVSNTEVGMVEQDNDLFNVTIQGAGTDGYAANGVPIADGTATVVAEARRGNQLEIEVDRADDGANDIDTLELDADGDSENSFADSISLEVLAAGGGNRRAKIVIVNPRRDIPLTLTPVA